VRLVKRVLPNGKILNLFAKKMDELPPLAGLAAAGGDVSQKKVAKTAPNRKPLGKGFGPLD
jgi:hypothetical protein